jgi:hypothetical protein
MGPMRPIKIPEWSASDESPIGFFCIIQNFAFFKEATIKIIFPGCQYPTPLIWHPKKR